MRNTTDTVVLGIGKVYKSTVVDIRTILTSSVHARSSGGRRGGGLSVFLTVTITGTRRSSMA